jgi:hypothetical protein
MPADPFTLRQANQARTDFAIIEDELEAIQAQFARLPKRGQLVQNRARHRLLLRGVEHSVRLIIPH